MRDEFYEHFDGKDFVNHAKSQANEVVSKGLAVFALCKGDPKQCILTSCNFGRDTDCLAAVSAGLGGALNGSASIPKEWIDQVNTATRADPYTNSKRTIEETAEGLYNACQAKNKNLRGLLEMMSS
jgi:hypothetical protein